VPPIPDRGGEVGERVWPPDLRGVGDEGRFVFKGPVIPLWPSSYSPGGNRNGTAGRA
jgi:hypothetical protein